MTMADILAVNPGILSATGTCLLALFSAFAIALDKNYREVKKQFRMQWIQVAYGTVFMPRFRYNPL